MCKTVKSMIAVSFAAYIILTLGASLLEAIHPDSITKEGQSYNGQKIDYGKGQGLYG
jgi:hypothetical protein